MSKVDLPKNNYDLFIGLISPVIFVLCGYYSLFIVIFLLLKNNLNLKNPFVKKKSFCIDMIGVMPLAFIISFFSKLILPDFEEQSKVIELKENFDKNLYKNIISIVIISPILEEIVFRKLFYRSLKKITTIGIAASVSSLIFGIIHFNVLSLIMLIFMSIFFTFIYEKYNSVIYPIIAHSLFNAIMLILIFITSDA